LSLQNDLVTQVERAIADWAKEGYEIVKADVLRNLSGTVLHCRTDGTLYRSIELCSKVEKDGFSISTDVKHGIAWEKGFSRKAYAINPVNRKALRWFEGGKPIFAKYVFIPAQTFAAKPFIRPAFEKNLQRLEDLLNNKLPAVLRDKVKFTLKFAA